MNEQNRPKINIIWQDAPIPSPGPVEVFCTVLGAILFVLFFLGGCHL